MEAFCQLTFFWLNMHYFHFELLAESLTALNMAFGSVAEIQFPLLCDVICKDPIFIVLHTVLCKNGGICHLSKN